MAEIAFTVPGVLPGWQRAGKNGKRHYTPAQTGGAEAEIAAWARQAAAGRRLSGALGLLVVSGRPMPQAWNPERRKAAVAGAELPIVKPDWDNLGKLVDALNKLVFKDDAQICDGRVVKVYMEMPLSKFLIWELSVEDRRALCLL